ncbi:MAG: protein DA1 [Chloroflexota bacterium]
MIVNRFMKATPVHTSSTLRDTCTACGKMLTGGYFYLRNRSERYCPECITNRPRCDVCSSPVDNNAWLLHDGRHRCSSCHETAVYDATEAHNLYEETVGSIIAQLQLTLRVGVAFRLVDAPTMAEVRSMGAVYPPEEKTLGLYRRQGSLRVIYLLYGLPRIMFRTVVAHEYAHAWQGETCPLLEDDELREGFAEWVAYRHLLYLGCTKAAQRMLQSSHPYRVFMESVLELEERVGPGGVVEHILAAGRGMVSNNPAP